MTFQTLYILLFYIINFVYRGIKDVMSPHLKSSCLWKRGSVLVEKCFLGTNRPITHPCALGKISNVRYLLSRVEQTKLKGLAYLNDVRLVLVHGAINTLFVIFLKS